MMMVRMAVSKHVSKLQIMGKPGVLSIPAGQFTKLFMDGFARNVPLGTFARNGEVFLVEHFVVCILYVQ
jgi:hypothetical protein